MRPLLALALAFAALGITAATRDAQRRAIAPEQVAAARIELGRRLFHDADLSINGTLSCASCHGPAQGFVDNVRTHPGAHGEPGLRNVPSLLNVAALAPLT
ncbi:hypothetical protein B2G71_01815 [Novosphingobium sp. PC22D]|nr:hypothetical protein B2G71_01815 [Novosphingobium sp. PC22D]